MDLTKIAELLGLHPSVIDNYYEEWEFENNQFAEEIRFKGYLCNIFAEAAFLNEALENESNVMTCLEIYDETYSIVEQILGEI